MRLYYAKVGRITVSACFGPIGVKTMTTRFLRISAGCSVTVGGLLLAIFFGGGLARGEEATTTADQKKSEAAVNDERFHAQLLEIAGKYKAFGSAYERPQLAAAACAAPSGNAFGAGAASHNEPRFSNSKDAGTHGQKLYYLFASDRKSLFKRDAGQPVGQILVKQSWSPKLVEATDEESPLSSGQTVKREGKEYQADEQLDLFIMAKLAVDTPGTDGGWIYGTVTPDGKTVTSAGKVHELRWLPRHCQGSRLRHRGQCGR